MIEAARAAAQTISEHSLAQGDCACGWKDENRESHSEHVVFQLQLSGLDFVWR